MKCLALIVPLVLGTPTVFAQAHAGAKKVTTAKGMNELDALELPEKFKSLPVREDLPPRIKKLVWIYMRRGIPYLAEEEDIKREEEYLANYKDKTYVKFLLVRHLRSAVSSNADGLEMAKEKGRSPEDIAEFEAGLGKLRNRLSIAEKWKP